MMGLAQPLWLLLLPVVLGLFLWRRHRSGTARMPVSRSGRVRPPLGVRLAPAVDGLKLLALLLLVLALAGPRVGEGKKTLKSEGIDIVLAIDVSRSMEHPLRSSDGRMFNRLEAVKAVVRDFVAGRPADRLGLVAFGSYAYTQLPLSLDHQALIQALGGLVPGSAGRTTAVGDGLGISLKRLESAKGKSQVVILLTDGASNDGQLSPNAAAQLASAAGVKVHCIGVSLNSPTLQSIARITGGEYFTADDKESLERIYATIDTLERHEIESVSYTEYHEYYAWFLAAAMSCLGLWLVLANTRFLRIP